ncbi:hypothetical protein LSH36_32g20072 [Paralvinella palmiformis]|uniref:Chitin-binding type-4 domain-containing protein n=1 Tax=Paralvinella palmiformis TaxID=53620 RepID=A0AAD9KAJ9_9ANNE|nr:hypothetical protein LSH36_32g20072 [Paralvinella palmiformis]
MNEGEKMVKTTSYLFVVLVVTSFRASSGHGRLLEPPSRSSLWRFPNQFPGAVPNYDDNGLNCGGRSYQHFSVDGNCGICGDKWIKGSNVHRPHEAGGKYAKGIITRHYGNSDVINVTIQVTASHKGYFEFRICPNNDVTKPATQDCLNGHLLSLEDGSTKFYYGAKTGFYHMRVRLPGNVVCSQCVFQWKWTTGNSWGVSPSGEGCVGCGPQEEFYGCSDISIGDNSASFDIIPTVNDAENEKTTTTTTAATTTLNSSVEVKNRTTADVLRNTSSCHGSETYKNTDGIDDWCSKHCAMGDCPKSHCVCSDEESTEQPAEQPGEQCHAAGVFANDPAMEGWCVNNCRGGFCPRTHCSCVGDEPRTVACMAVGVWTAISGMNEWCELNCQLGFCPASHCLCV